MAKKKTAPEFKMSEVIRGILTENPKLSNKEVKEAVLAKYPTATINENSFSVACYNAKKKLFGPTHQKSKKAKTNPVAKVAKSAARPSVDLATLQAAAKFLGEVGNADVALAAIKQVQGLQVK